MQHALGPITVTTAGTPVPIISAATPCQSLLIQAFKANTGYIYVLCGGVRVATLAIPTANSIPSFSVTIPDAPGGLNPAQYTLDASVSGEGADASFARP